MAIVFNTRGIVPSDIILRRVIIEGLNDLRLHPELLDDVFGTLLAEDSAATYGQAELDAATRWFRNTDVPVRVSQIPEPPNATSIVIQLADGAENEATLADIHYQPTDSEDRIWPVLAGPTNPKSYDPITGLLTLLDSETLVVIPGMVIVDKNGEEHSIHTVSGKVIGLGPGLMADFDGFTIRGLRPAQAVALESIREKETYQVGIHVHGNVAYLSWLFPIVKYVLYRGRQELERRGIEDVKYSFTGPEENPMGGSVENIYSRYVNVQASCRQTWVKKTEGRIYNVDTDLQVSNGEVIVDFPTEVITPIE